jgi:hypothetical protein
MSSTQLLRYWLQQIANCFQGLDKVLPILEGLKSGTPVGVPVGQVDSGKQRLSQRSESINQWCPLPEEVGNSSFTGLKNHNEERGGISKRRDRIQVIGINLSFHGTGIWEWWV